MKDLIKDCFVGYCVATQDVESLFVTFRRSSDGDWINEELDGCPYGGYCPFGSCQIIAENMDMYAFEEMDDHPKIDPEDIPF